jgi:alpha-ketoglutarate-dependent taurine dioxygenase
MSHPEQEKPSLNKAAIGRRRSINVAASEIVRATPLFPDTMLPLVVQPTAEGVDLLHWAQHNRDYIETHLHKHGGLLFRDFMVRSVAEFEQFVANAVGGLLEYRERSSPRSQVSGNVYTSTDHPPDQTIFLHNENSYAHTWPLKIAFCCLTSAEQGGETPIADCRNILAKIDPQVVARFVEKKVLYVRNFGDGFGLPWQTVFQTSDKHEVEAYCAKVGLRPEWKDNGRLRTYRVGAAVARHPRTGELTWFNHATFFHVSTLPAEIGQGLLSALGEENLPTNTYYGDGEPIEPAVLDMLREIYRQETVSFRWQVGDILLLDNMLVAHGRAPFTGARKVVVAMAQPISDADLHTETLP